MKKVIKLNESQLRNIVSKTLKRIVESVDGNAMTFIEKYGEGDFRKGNPLYNYLSNLSNYDFSVFSMDAEDNGYDVMYDVIGDYYTVKKKKSIDKIIRESVKRVLSEAGHITWKDEDGRMNTTSKDTWHGVKGSTFVWHGEHADPEIYFEYQGEQYIINGNEAEDWLWDLFKEYCEENNINPDEHYNDEVYDNFAKQEAEGVLLDMGPYNEHYGE